MKPQRFSKLLGTAFALASTVLGLLGNPASAQAGVITTPNPACRPYGGPSADALTANESNQAYTSNGDFTISRKIICPVVRQGDGDGVTVYVDGRSESETAPVSCILW